MNESTTEMHVHDLGRLLVLCAILQGTLANGSTKDFPISWQRKNPRQASCPTCPKDCPDMLSSPWYGKPVIDESSPNGNDPDEKSKSQDPRKWSRMPESLQYMMSSREHSSRQPADYRLLKHTNAPTIAPESTYETGRNFDEAYFPNNAHHHATNEGNVLKLSELYQSVRKQPETEEKQLASQVLPFESSFPDKAQEEQKKLKKILAELEKDERRKELSAPTHRFKSRVNRNEADKVVTIALTDEEMHSLFREGVASGEQPGIEYRSHQSQPFSLSQPHDASTKIPIVVEEDMNIFLVDTEESETDNRERSQLAPLSFTEPKSELMTLQSGTSEEDKANTGELYTQPRGGSYDQWWNSETSDNRNNDNFEASYKYASLLRDKELPTSDGEGPLLNDKNGNIAGYAPEGSYEFPDDSAYFASHALYRKLKENQVSPLPRSNVCQRMNPFGTEQIKEIGECFAPMPGEEYVFVNENNDRRVQDESSYARETNTEVLKDYVEAQNPAQSIYEYLDTQASRNNVKNRDSNLNEQYFYNTYTPEDPATGIEAQNNYEEQPDTLNETNPLTSSWYNQSPHENILYNVRPQRAFDNVRKGEIRYANFPELMVEIKKRTIPQYKDETRQSRQFQIIENKETAKLDENDNYPFRYGTANNEDITEKNGGFNMNISKFMDCAENKSKVNADTVHIAEHSRIYNNTQMFMGTNTTALDQTQEQETLPNFDPDLLDDFEEPMEPTEPTSSADFMESSTKI